MPEEKLDPLTRYVSPPLKKCRVATDQDIDKILSEAGIMFDLCELPHGKYPNAFAIAHNQIEKEDPIAFFVSIGGDIIINPSIIKHSNYVVEKMEGCMSYPDRPMVSVDRWQKCEVEYQSITDDGEKLTEKEVIKLSGKEAEVYQHEIEHLEGKSIYDNIIEIKPYEKSEESQKISKSSQVISSENK